MCFSGIKGTFNIIQQAFKDKQKTNKIVYYLVCLITEICKE